jgi:glycosyltransferase involved in cell wall biosynthesis
VDTTGRLEFVVAAHDAEASIRPCVESLLALGAASRVTVVNDASHDRTEQILAQIADPRLRVMGVGYRSRARAANVGFRASECDVVCSVDADVRYVRTVSTRSSPCWLYGRSSC